MTQIPVGFIKQSPSSQGRGIHKIPQVNFNGKSLRMAINIHARKLLGNPETVEILVNPTTRQMIIKPTVSLGGGFAQVGFKISKGREGVVPCRSLLTKLGGPDGIALAHFEDGMIVIDIPEGIFNIQGSKT